MGELVPLATLPPDLDPFGRGSIVDQQREDQLVALASQGDSDALGDLLMHLAPQLRARLEPEIGQQYTSMINADDILQVTFLEAFLRFDRFEQRGAGAVLAWLTRIAQNNLRDAIRGLEAAKRPSPGKRVQSARSNDESYDGLVMALGATFSTPSVKAARHEAHRFLDEAIEALPEDYAVVIRAFDLDGASASDIATELGRSVGAVYMLRARAHESLRDAMGSETRYFSLGG